MQRNVFFIGFVLTLTCLLSACGGSNSRPNEQTAQSVSDTARAPIEIMYFYGKQRCVTCRAIEQVVVELTQKYMLWGKLLTFVLQLIFLRTNLA